MGDATSESSWTPNRECLDILLAMGIAKNIACEALFCTGNTSVDEAVNYVFNNEEHLEKHAAATQAQTEEHQQQTREDRNEGESSECDEEEDVDYYKMTFVVNTALKMGTGKIAAQVGHACLGLYRILQSQNMTDGLKQWEFIGEKKIVLKGTDQVHLETLKEKAKGANIPCYLVRDAGHTQVEPGSVTVLSLFGREDEVNRITGKLSLL